MSSKAVLFPPDRMKDKTPRRRISPGALPDAYP
jgi:hypothetical protein